MFIFKIWTGQQSVFGTGSRLNSKLPFRVHLFKVVATNGDIEWVITNREQTQVPMTTQDVQNENAVRWQIEQMHRELKQLVGTEK